MASPATRYTDQELVAMLRILASDYNKRPTQRAILADERLPTHHTFNKRFGSVLKALDAAGLKDLADNSAMHDMARDVIEHFGDDIIIDEYAQIGPIIVDFIIDGPKGKMVIDIVNMEGVDPRVEEEICKMRIALAIGNTNMPYHIVKNAGDIIELLS